MRWYDDLFGYDKPEVALLQSLNLIDSGVEGLGDSSKQQAVIDAVLAKKSDLLQRIERPEAYANKFKVWIDWSLPEWKFHHQCWNFGRGILQVHVCTWGGTRVGVTYVTLMILSEASTDDEDEDSEDKDVQLRYGPFECQYIKGWIGPAKVLSTSEEPSWLPKEEDGGVGWDDKVLKVESPQQLEKKFIEFCDYAVRVLSVIPEEERKCLRREYYNNPLGWVCSGKIGIMVEKEEGTSCRVTLKEYIDCRDTLVDRSLQ